MEMDRDAYERSEVYRKTPPAERILQVEQSRGKAQVGTEGDGFFWT
jgi:hypothetical protein